MSQNRDSMPSIDESDNEEDDSEFIDEEISTSDYSSLNRGKNATLRKGLDCAMLKTNENVEKSEEVDECDKSATLKAVDNTITIDNDGDNNVSENGLPLADDLQPDRFGFFHGHQYTEPNSELIVPIEVTRSRERKWQEMLNKWDEFKIKRRKKLTVRCRKGIPQSMRCKAWQFLCSSRSMEATFQERAYYKEQLKPSKKLDSSRSSFRNSALAINNYDNDSVSVASFYSVAPSMKSQSSMAMMRSNNHELYDNYKKCPANVEVVEQIRKDIHRQFPNHDFFMTKGGMGQESLSTLLTVYSIRRPETGYCQGMAPLAAAILMVMPEEEAFWTFDRICENYIPGYYDDGLKQIQADAKALNILLKKENSFIYNQLNRHQIDPICYMVDWFMCIFIRTLPWPSVLLVMDMFLCEGKVILFKVALVLIIGALTTITNTNSSISRHDSEDQQDTDLLTLLRRLPDEVTTPKYIMTHIARLSVTKTDIKKESHKQEKLIRDSSSLSVIRSSKRR